MSRIQHTQLTYFQIFSAIAQQMTSLYTQGQMYSSAWISVTSREERIHMWQATSLLSDVNSTSLHGGGIFVKIHTRVATHIRYMWYTFRCDRPIITRTLHEHQKSVFSAQLEGIFVKIHTRVATHISYMSYKFHCHMSIITGTLHEQ